MASNREERKLMRQRGAANRKVQDVDFGFSFGTPKLEGPQESPQRPPSSAPKPSTQSPPQTRTPPNTRLSLPSVPLSQRTPVRSSSQGSSARTPGSARNDLPVRPSVYDIPLDDGEPNQRSPKRRKLSAVRDSNEDGSSSKEPALDDTRDAPATSQAGQEPTVNGTSDPVLQPPPANATGSSDQRQSPSPRREVASGEATSQTDQNHEEGGVTKDNEIVEDRSHQTQHTKNPPRKKKKRKSVVVKFGKSRKSAANDPRRTSGGSQQSIGQSAAPDNPAELHGHQLPEEPASQSSRGRKPTEQKSNKQKTALQQNNKRKTEQASGSRQQQYQEDREDESREQDEEHPVNGETPTEAQAKRAAEIVADEANDGAEDEHRQKAQRESGHNASGEGSVRQQKETKRSRRRRYTEDTQPRATPTAPESKSQQVVATSKKKPNRKSQKSEQQQNPGKERKSRGETVPIVVHRLTNLSALDVDSHEPSVDDENARGESSTGHQYLSRGGTNAADVLGQICSETLEKTMSTLDNSISQESNSGRRAEWTRKRKAVETFNTELDNRLFETSEINESNFVLAAQLKREKKEMEALRSRLMDARKERGDIALQIDDVRRQYAEDQNAKTEQDNLNNALHDLQLALDRSHQGKEDTAETNPFAGLEFLLRTVAQDVSSVAPDSHGGLLSQVRNFNAQLERTASSFEPKR